MDRESRLVIRCRRTVHYHPCMDSPISWVTLATGVVVLVVVAWASVRLIRARRFAASSGTAPATTDVPRIDAPQALEHYLYISQPKVEKLYNQLPDAGAASVKSTQEVGGGPLPAKHTIEVGEPPPPSLEVKLRRVMSSIPVSDIADVDAADRRLLFRGTMPMKYGLFPVRRTAEPTIAMWIGVSPKGRLVCLGGSGAFVDGSIPHGPYDNSGVSTLLLSLQTASRRAETSFREDDRRLGAMSDGDPWNLPGAWDAEVWCVWRDYQAPATPVSFAAYWLTESVAHPDGHELYDVLLGTPIYVSRGRPGGF